MTVLPLDVPAPCTFGFIVHTRLTATAAWRCARVRPSIVASAVQIAVSAVAIVASTAADHTDVFQVIVTDPSALGVLPVSKRNVNRCGSGAANVTGPDAAASSLSVQ